MIPRSWTVVEVIAIGVIVFAAVFAGASTGVVVLLAVACVVVAGVIQFLLLRRSVRESPPDPPGRV